MNCRGLQDRNKRLDVFNFLRQKRFSLYLLQDVHLTEQEKNKIRAEWGYEIILNSYSSQSRGTLCLLSNTFEYKIHDLIKDDIGNMLILDININDKRYSIVNIYGPNNDKPDFFENLKHKLLELDNPYTIIGGDYNLVLNQDNDTYNYLHVNNPRAKEKLVELIDDLGLIDVWRNINPETKKYTWRRHHPSKQARLDFFLVSENLIMSVKNAKIESGYRTDHSLITLELQFDKFKRRSSFWKLNNSLLQDLEYVNTIKSLILDVKKQYVVPVYNLDNLKNVPNDNIEYTINDQLFFETLLMEIRGKTIAYATNKRIRNKREEILLKRIELNENLISFDSNKQEELEKDKKELESLRKIKMDGVKIRSKARWVDEGEKMSKYFCGLENRNFVSKTMTKLINENGEEVNEQKDILTETKIFYENLYKNKDENIETNIDLNHLIKDKEVPKLNNIEKANMEGLISKSEALYALKNTSNNKSPGSSGFSAEFYKVFWIDLGDFLVRSINYGYAHGKLSVTQRQGVITCLPKANKSKHFLKNWRPISLLNIEYKIASSCIAERIKKVLPRIINKDQTGFVKGRYIGENIRLVYDVINYAEQYNKPGMILLVDFEKAFDSVSWTFIQKTLSFFNFGTSIKNWVQTFYSDISSCVLVNGSVTDWFKIGRGCRQGDPLSPYLFLLCAEILAILVREEESIRGITIKDKMYTLSQYADDTTFLLDGSKQSLVNTLNLLTYFSKISGLKINMEKTKVIWIGSKKGSSIRYCEQYNLVWNPETFVILGVEFSVNLKAIIKLNYSQKIVEIKKLLQQWSKRLLTPIGKITVIKALALSKLNHLFATLPKPCEEILQTINRLFFKFIWSDKNDRIKRTLLCADFSEGGLRMIDIHKFINANHVSWIRRMIFNTSKWGILINDLYPDIELVYYGSTFPKEYLSKIKNTFWKDVLISWNLYTTQISKQYQNNPLNVESLWFNPKFKIGNRTVFYRDWYNSGIRTVDDLINTQNTFINSNELETNYGIKNTFLKLQSITASIKQFQRHSRQKIVDKKVSVRPMITNQILFLIKYSKGCRYIYDILRDKQPSPKSIQKWSRDLNNIENKDWKTYFSLPFIITKDTTLHWFQTRLIHRILSTNKYLNIINIKDSGRCTFCAEETETLVHLFWNCPISQNIWNQIYSSLNIKDCFPDFKFTPENVILGLPNKSNKYIALNIIILKTKYIIYRHRCQNNTNINIQSIHSELKSLYQLEKYISKIHDNTSKFDEIWAPFRNVLVIP